MEPQTSHKSRIWTSRISQCKIFIGTTSWRLPQDISLHTHCFHLNMATTENSYFWFSHWMNTYDSSEIYLKMQQDWYWSSKHHYVNISVLYHVLCFSSWLGQLASTAQWLLQEVASIRDKGELTNHIHIFPFHFCGLTTTTNPIPF